jgi:hypothetical protein
LIAAPERRRQMGERGRSVALEQFTDSVMARRYEAIYRTVMSRARGGRARVRGGRVRGRPQTSG